MRFEILRRGWPYVVIFLDFAAFAVVIFLVISGISLALDRKATPTEIRLIVVGFIGLALSAYLAYTTTVKPFLRKPRFHIAVDLQWSSPTQSGETGSWFYRLRIENYGLTPAEGCVGRLLDVWTSSRQRIGKFDPLNLYWTRQDQGTGFSPIALQAGGDFSFLDIAQVSSEGLTLRVAIPKGMTLTSEPEGSPSPGNGPRLSLPGIYFARVGIYSENAFDSPTLYRIECSGFSPPPSEEEPPCQITKARTIRRLSRSFNQQGDEI